MKMLTIYLDGEYKKVSENTLRALSPGLLKGLGVFETLNSENGKVYFLTEHYRRFLHGVDRYILPKPPALGEIKKILKQLLKDNQLQTSRIRFAAWRKGWQLHFAMMALERLPFPESVYRRGFSACIFQRPLDRSFHLAKVKSLDYGFFLKAYEYALKHKCHEALLLNSSGHIVEGSRSNVFFVKDNKLVTPSLQSGCLAGVTRQAVVSASKDLKIRTSMAHVTLADLKNFDEAFLTNALVGIMPLVNVAGHKIGSGHPGPLTQRLSKSYEKLSQAKSTFLV